MTITAAHAKSRGGLLAKVLAGAWRHSPPALEMSAEELTEITPLLLGSGAGAMGWWRVRHSDLCTSPPAQQLQEAYRSSSLHSGIHKHEIQQVFKLFRASGVEPVLIKGWAIARAYPEQGLRVYGDTDLCVRPEQYAAAEAVWRSPEARPYWVDLHRGFEKLDDRSADELYTRSQLIKLGDTEVRVPGPEDHLRILCVHLLHHGAYRPSWLCDIGAALEARPAGFNWDDCLGSNRRRADWVGCAIGLAHRLLGARVDDTPVAERARRLPRWLLPAVLKQWENPCPVDQGQMKIKLPMAAYLRHPSGVLQALRYRWPDPIGSTIAVEGAFNEIPRLAFQLGYCAARIIKFLPQIPRSLRAHSSSADPQSSLSVTGVMQPPSNEAA